MATAMKHSRQREALITMLRSRYDHPTAEQLYSDLKSEFPRISLGTVYRNLRTLVDSGQLITLETSLGTVHYDADLSEHDHFVCEECGRISDLFIPGCEKERLEADGYEVKAVKRIFYGICKECNK